MADEITIFTGLNVRKGGLVLDVQQGITNADMAGSRAIRNVQTIGTTYEAVVTGDLATAGWCTITNLDATNYVEFGVEVAAAFYPFVRVDAGEKAGPFKLATLSVFARANTAAVNADITITEA